MRGTTPISSYLLDFCNFVTDTGSTVIGRAGEIGRPVVDAFEVVTAEQSIFHETMVKAQLLWTYPSDEERVMLDKIVAKARELHVLGDLSRVIVNVEKKPVIDIQQGKDVSRQVTTKDLIATMYTVVVVADVINRLRIMNPNYGDVIPPLKKLGDAYQALLDGRIRIVYKGSDLNDGQKDAVLSGAAYVMLLDLILLGQLPKGEGDILLQGGVSLVPGSCIENSQSGAIIHEFLHSVQDMESNKRDMAVQESENHTLQMLYVSEISGSGCIDLQLQAISFSSSPAHEQTVRQLFLDADAEKVVSAIFVRDGHFGQALDRVKYWKECLSGQRQYNEKEDAELVGRFVDGYHKLLVGLQNRTALQNFFTVAEFQDFSRLDPNGSYVSLYNFETKGNGNVLFANMESYYESQKRHFASYVEKFRALTSASKVREVESAQSNVMKVMEIYVAHYFYLSRSGRIDEAHAFFENELYPLLTHKSWSVGANQMNGLTVYK